MDCVNKFKIDNFDCLKPCSGIIATSFSKSNLNKELEDVDLIYQAYNNYKKITEYPPGYTGKNTFSFNLFFDTFNLDFKWTNNLRYVGIIFDTPTFDRIEKDRAAKFVDMLSAIGGTMGLLTGFSIISGVEILYFAGKFMVNFIKKMN